MKIKEQEISTLPVQEAREEKHQDKNLAVECDFNTDSVMRANNSENDAKDSLTSPEESVRHFLNVLGEKKSQTISMNIETEGKTVEEVKKEFDKLTIDIEKRTIYFNEQVQELEKRLQGDVNFALPDTAGVISSILSDVKRTSEIINLTQKAAENVNDDYRQKQLLQAGFNSVEEVSDKINDLESQGDVFRRKFLGEKRFGGKIRKINSEITLLDNLSQSQQEDAQIPRIDSLFQERFKAVQIKIIENFVNDLSFEYEKLSNQLSNQEKGEKKLSSDILESLAEDYVEKYFKTEIEEELQALMEKEESAKSPDRYRRNTIRILRDSNLVNEAVVILKEGLNKPHVIKSGNQGNYTDIEREEIEVLDSRLRTLPCQLEDIVRRGMMEDGNTANDQFAKFIEQVEKAPINIQKEIIESSFSRVKQQIIDALHSGDVHRSDQIHLSKRMEETEKTLKSEKELDFLQTVDMKQWNVFKDNKCQNLE